MQATRKSSRPKKEVFYVAVADSDNSVTFFNATDHLGKTMPFEKPKATCAVRAGVETVCFSLLHLTKRSASNIVDAPLELPRGPLAKLERRAGAVGELADGQVVVEHESGTHQLKLTRDDNGIATLDMAEGDDVAFELPKGAVNISVYLKSPVAPRTLAVGFIGHLGKPGDTSTMTRAVSMVLFSLSQLPDFKILSGIETVTVPSPPSKYQARRVVRRADERAAVLVPTRLFSDDVQPQLLGQGEVGVEVDLENANPSSGRLLFQYQPSKELEEVFPEFRAIYDSTVSALVTSHLGADEVAAITVDIVLGSVEAGTIERLKEALSTLTGLDCTPTQYRLFQP